MVKGTESMLEEQSKVPWLDTSDLSLKFSLRHHVIVHNKNGMSILPPFTGVLVSLITLHHFNPSMVKTHSNIVK